MACRRTTLESDIRRFRTEFSNTASPIRHGILGDWMLTNDPREKGEVPRSTHRVCSAGAITMDIAKHYAVIAQLRCCTVRPVDYICTAALACSKDSASDCCFLPVRVDDHKFDLQSVPVQRTCKITSFLLFDIKDETSVWYMIWHGT